MNNLKTFVAFITLLIYFFCSYNAASEEGAYFKDFSGVCQANGNSTLAHKGYIGWIRLDMSWDRYEPQKGIWNEKAYKERLRLIENIVKKGIKVLPILAYGTSWTMIYDGHEIIEGDIRKVYTKGNDKNSFNVSIFHRKNNQWIMHKTEPVKYPRIRILSEYRSSWEKYVKRLVTDLKKPPYNIKYFQIWNEAHPDNGFWGADLDSYMQTVHLPAAKIIHNENCKVVYGGFPCCGTADQLSGLLDKHKAWKSIDVIDIHYFGIQYMFWLLKKAEEAGRNNLGSWQTEVGFSHNYSYIPQHYPLTIYHGLKKGWSFPDRFKLFYFAKWSPDDPKAFGYNKCLYKGNELTLHGKALDTLGSLFNNKKIHVFDGLSTTPEYSTGFKDSYIIPLKTEDNIIITTVLKKSECERINKTRSGIIQYTISGMSGKKINKIQRVGIFGSKTNLNYKYASNPDKIIINAPINYIQPDSTSTEPAGIFYLNINISEN